MRYLHYIEDENGNLIGIVYSANQDAKISLNRLVQLGKGIYKIWDRVENKIIQK